MALAVNSIVSVQLWGTCLGQRIILDLWYRVSVGTVGSSSDVQDLSNICNAFDGIDATSVTRKYLLCLPANYTINEIRSQKVYPLPRTTYISLAQSLTGLMPEDTNVVNCAAAMTLRTNEGGYGQHATKHIGPIGESDFSDGNLGATLYAAVGALAQACIQPLAVDSGPVIQPIVYHKNGDGPTAKSTDVTNAIVNRLIRVQRRRTVGLGI